jgi:multidrug efflux system outer membrane protein
MSKSHTIRAGLALATAAALSACTSFTPDYQRPKNDLPETFGKVPAGSLTASTTGGRWWTLFGDAKLTLAVEDALRHNAGVELAVARVDEARAQLALTGADLLPTVSGSFSRSRSQSSQRGAIPLPAGVPRESNSYRAAVDVSYEIDLWDRLMNTQSAARAELLATEAARDTVKMALAADVVQGWYALAALDQQLADTRRALETRNAALGLQKRRFDAGMISEFELRQLDSEVAAAEAQLPALERRRLAQHTALGVLLGRTPREITEERGGRTVLASSAASTATSSAASSAAARAPDAAVPLVVPAGLPSELLLRRPDIVQAEQRMIAANARIAVARAAVFPSITLTGFLGSQSAGLADLFSGPAGIWSLAAALAQPIFSGGRQEAGIAVAQARERQALAQYQLAVQTAFREVRDALDGQQAARAQLEAEERRANALRDAQRIARLRYDNGMASQLDLLDAERNLLAAELNVAEARRAQRAAVADLFKALGGGW